ncbi:MAG TPA: PRC-barrel domain-containing protein [Terriglobales bacterium]|nr:PRC-barrel domain-containing protein [Terriglobales bacterium]
MLRRFRDLPSDSITDDIRGAAVYDHKNEKLGTIDDIVYDTERSDGGYAIVDSGGWLKSRKFLIPTNRLETYSDDEFRLPIGRDEIGRLPEYDDAVLSDPMRFNDYRTRWNSAWTNTSALPARHRRIEAIENRFRDRDTRTAEVRPISSDRAVSYAPREVSVYGVFHDREKVRETVEHLKREGFQDNDISVVFPDRDESKNFALEHNTKAPEGATAGGLTGAVTGGVLGWLAGVGMIAIPGIGPLLAAGPIVAALAGAGAVGVAGGLVGALVGMGLPELEAKRYESEVKAGRILVAVHCDDARFSLSARTVLEKAGAKDVFVSQRQIAA